jgi:capsular polysaccharide biosynthesis protein
MLKLLESFFRHRWLYLLPIVVMIVAAGIAIAIAKPRYSSAGSLYVQSGSLVNSLNNLPKDGGVVWITQSQVTTNQIKELLQTEAFVRSVVKGTLLEVKLNGDVEQRAKVIKDVNKALIVAPAGDNLVTFGAEFEDPKVAYQLASQLTESYILWKLNSDRQDSLAAQSFFVDLAPPYQDTLDKARRALEDYIKTHPTPVRGERPELESIEVTRLQGEVSQAQTRVEEVRQKEESARLAQIQAERGVRQAYLIIDAPKVPIKRINGLQVLVMSNLLFVIVGVILSVIGVIGSALIDRSLRFPMDVVNDLHLPVLAAIPNRPLMRIGILNTIAHAVVQDEHNLDLPIIVQQPLTSSLAQNPNE